MSPNIFTEDRIAQVRQQYHGIRPDIYYLACEECGEPIREKIEEWANALPPDIVDEIAPLLLDRERFRSTYGELVTMYHLVRLDFEFEYEKELPDGKTPDLSVCKSPRGPAFMCEVYTEGVSAEMAKRLTPVKRLRKALTEISLDCAIALRRSQKGHDLQGLDAGAVAREVERWLQKEASVGETAEFGPVEAEVIQRGQGYSHLQLMGPWTVYRVPESRPWGKLNDKAAKYAGTAQELECPLVLAYVSNFFMGTDPDTIANTLFGQKGVEVGIRTGSGEPVAARTFRRDDGIFTEGNPALSAVLVVTENDGHIKTTAFHNPNAVNPLPDAMFESE